jgi:hypothetical protein
VLTNTQKEELERAGRFLHEFAGKIHCHPHDAHSSGIAAALNVTMFYHD